MLNQTSIHTLFKMFLLQEKDYGTSSAWYLNRMYGQEENMDISAEGSTCVGSSQTRESKKKRKNSIRARDEAAAKLYTQLGLICDAIEKRSIILARNDDCSYSIAKVMDMLRSMAGIETGSGLFWVATKLFLKKIKQGDVCCT